MGIIPLFTSVSLLQCVKEKCNQISVLFWSTIFLFNSVLSVCLSCCLLLWFKVYIVSLILRIMLSLCLLMQMFVCFPVRHIHNYEEKKNVTMSTWRCDVFVQLLNFGVGGPSVICSIYNVAVSSSNQCCLLTIRTLQMLFTCGGESDAEKPDLIISCSEHMAELVVLHAQILLFYV